MAWYAELKRRKWFCIVEMDMITLYKQKLFDDWYDSLSEEEIAEILKRREERKQREREHIRKVYESFLKLSIELDRRYRGVWR